MIVVYLTKNEVKTVLNNAKDDIDSHLGRAAVSKYLTGNIEAYEKAVRNAFPHEGSDLVGVNVVVRTNRDDEESIVARCNEPKWNTLQYIAEIPKDVDNIVYIRLAADIANQKGAS